jgi:glycosyltransferase involved in cell wall biosynthesis
VIPFTSLPPVHRVALIGNNPPRRCGLATFTADLRAALLAARPDLEISTLAMTDPGTSHAYPPAVGYELRQNEPADYAAAVEHINASNPDVVCLQHEYGIFGGPAGDMLLPLVRSLRAPLVTTLHTVLIEPNDDQRRVLDALVDASARVVVMAEMGRDILVRGMGVPAAKVSVIPHGIPDLPFLDPAFHKHRFGLDGRRVLLTFGLLSPNKGIEVMIEALPALIAKHPDLVYVVLGATHPHLVAREGEAYRDELAAQAARLGVAAHVRFVNEYVDDETLQAWLSAADIYVTPYLSEAQITSGTLSYAVGLGKAVVSTPYWHARELLGEERGVLVPFADAGALGSAIGDLLDDERRRHRLRRNAYAAGRAMIWPRVGELYLAEFGRARAERLAGAPNVVSLRPAPAAPPQPSLDAVARMTDGCGMLQHAIASVPDRRHGYCLDDNARALMLVHELAEVGVETEKARALAPVYAAFVNAAWDDARGRFRNFMGHDRRWLEEIGSDDSFGRALWALGHTAARTSDHGLKLWATNLADRAIAHVGALTSPRAWAFAALGLVAYLRVYPGHRPARAQLAAFADRLADLLRAARGEDWCWFEPVLAYDNARLPEALIRAGEVLERPELAAGGLEALEWLTRLQTAPGGHFRPVGTESYGRERQPPLPFDQQPLEAWATVAACESAHAVTAERRWLGEAQRAFAWFLGANDLGARVAAPGGGCYDGLLVDRVNLNQGAESILAYQLAACAMLRQPASAHGSNGKSATGR